MIGCDCEVCRSLDFKDKRLRSSIHIHHENVSLVVDTGPDFRQQMLRERIKRLDGVLFTHEHRDHTAGLDDIRSFNFKQKQDIPIYGRNTTLDQLKREFSYVFSDHKYPGVPQVTPLVINKNEEFKIRDEVITPIEVMHYKLPVFGFRVRDFTYITDAKSIDHGEISKIKGSKVVVLNALRIEEHISHFNLQEAVEMATEIGADKTYLTHISHLLGKHRTVSKDLPDTIELAWDGLKIEID